MDRTIGYDPIDTSSNLVGVTIKNGVTFMVCLRLKQYESQYERQRRVFD